MPAPRQYSFCSRPPVPERSWGDVAFGAAAVPIDVPKDATDGFGPLKTILEATSVAYIGRKVRS